MTQISVQQIFDVHEDSKSWFSEMKYKKSINFNNDFRLFLLARDGARCLICGDSLLDEANFDGKSLGDGKKDAEPRSQVNIVVSHNFGHGPNFKNNLSGLAKKLAQHAQSSELEKDAPSSKINLQVTDEQMLVFDNFSEWHYLFSLIHAKCNNHVGGLKEEGVRTDNIFATKNDEVRETRLEFMRQIVDKNIEELLVNVASFEVNEYEYKIEFKQQGQARRHQMQACVEKKRRKPPMIPKASESTPEEEVAVHISKVRRTNL